MAQDEISPLLPLKLLPNLLQEPAGLESGKVRRDLKIDCTVRDEYSGDLVNLEEQIHRIFYQHGRIRPHDRVLCYFPKYMQLYFDTTECLLWGSECANLELSVKLYLGIMAASCYQCTYLLNILEAQFVLHGGDVSWVTDGLKAVPSKIAQFAKTN